MIAHLGILNDLEFVRDVMAVPEFVEKVRRHMQAAGQDARSCAGH